MSKERRNPAPKREESWLKKRGEKDKLQNLTDISGLEELDKTRDLGFASQDLIAWIYGTDKLLKLTDYNPIIAEENFRFLKEQLALALKREGGQGQREQLAKKKRMDQQRAIKRQVYRIGLPVLAVLSVLGIGDVAYNNIFSPEATAQRQAQETADKIKFENENTLGLKPSSLTFADWRIRYPLKEQNVDYIESERKEDKIIIRDGSNMLYGSGVFKSGSSTSFGKIGIYINNYKRSDGMVVPKLKIITKGSNPNQDRILRNQPTDETDNRVVVLERLEWDEVMETKYLSFEKMETEPNYFKVKVMQKVVKKQ